MRHASDNMVIMLVGNKCDLEHKRRVSYQEGQEFAEQHNLVFMETSAKEATHVEKAFITTAETIYDKIKTGEIDVDDDSNGVKRGPQSSSSSSYSSSSNSNSTVGLGSGGKKDGGGCCGG
eukprot:TRINITY_DN335_c0_g1_i2.p2 TRINITY_DN335_c0_g1~~TRINITY_DN335_c0_g1_i2.p2  ORF type:complete len:120 (-),score=33.80 TRINITY_DN335_c0_g1_i2:42-401(-)